MRRNIYAFITILALAGCAKEVSDSDKVSTDRTVTGSTRIAKAGENLQITVTLPEVKGLETRVSLSGHDSCGE